MTFSFLPTSLSSYKRRILTGRLLGILLVFTLTVGTEMHFSWIESMAGAFLLSTNDFRSESGAIWEQGHQSESAQDALKQHMDRRQDVQREVRQAASMGQVIGGIDAGRGAMISAAHFLQPTGKPLLRNRLISFGKQQMPGHLFIIESISKT